MGSNPAVAPNSLSVVTEEEEGEQVKETFAHYGRACYMANVVETGLAHVLMEMEFMASLREEYIRTKGKSFTRDKYEADFDAYMDKQFALTMGNLIRRVNALSDFPDELKNRIGEAHRRRNFLIHHYWREMAVHFSSSHGRTKMIEELSADAEAFGQLDADIQAATKPAREKLGMTDEVLRAHSEAYMEKVRAGIVMK